MENLQNMLLAAREENYAVGAFNVYNVEDMTAVLNAAEKKQHPVILMTTSSAVEHTGIEELSFIAHKKTENISVPAALHLDHATDFDLIVKAIKAGYSSVMFDGSSLSYSENIDRTREIVKMAEPVNVSVEGEIGRVGGAEDSHRPQETVLSDPEKVKEFCEKTGVDACAVSIGTQHGMQKQEADIDFEVLNQIRKAVKTPLVMHGSSGVSDEDVKRVSQGKIQKINIGTRLKRVFTDELREKLENYPDVHNHVEFLQHSMKALEKEVMKKIELMR